MHSNALAAGIRRLRSKMAAQGRSEESDEQCLHAFTARGDENAFAVLVRRHGPMVLHVCRRVMGHEQDAEDAFQAVFLLLARRAAGHGDCPAGRRFAPRVQPDGFRLSFHRRKQRFERGTKPADPYVQVESGAYRDLGAIQLKLLPDSDSE